MNFFRKNLEETVNAFNNLLEQGDAYITVKKVRKENGIKSTDRSKLIFYSRSLQHLVRRNKLEENGVKKPRQYKIVASQKITIDDVYP